MLEVLIDFAGDKKTSSRTIFPWLLAEDNPVISCYGNNSLNQAGTTRSCSAGEKLPESTGDKLPVGEMNSNFPGEILIGVSWGTL